jgi:cell division septum initiation protein DivIVA
VTENGTTFHTVSDGYDPGEVDRRIAELTRATKTAQQHAHELHLQLAEQEQTARTDGPDETAEPDFTALGEHVGNVIRAAHEAADAIRADAQTDADAARAEAQRLVSAATAKAEELIAAADRRVAETSRQRNAIFAELATLRDHLPSVLGSVATASAKQPPAGGPPRGTGQ